MDEALTRADRLAAFKRATGISPACRARWAERAQSGMSDKDLEAVLSDHFGELGGHSGPDQICVTFQRAGLTIWASWHMMPIPSDDRTPIFKGAATIAMTREVYGIGDPTAHQMELI